MAVRELIEGLGSLSVTPESISYLKEAGIDPASIEPHCGFLTVALANFFAGPSGTVFRLSCEGQPTVVIGGRTATREEPRDLVAWPLYGHRRDIWGSFNLSVDLLGIPAALDSYRTRKPLRLHRTPEDWVLSGFEGACIVNKRWGGMHLQRLACPLVCEDALHGRELATSLKPYGKDCLVHVPAPTMREAA